MKAKTVFLVVSLGIMLLATGKGYGQTGSPEYKDTSQVITKKELFKERADRKARRNKEKVAKLRKQKDTTIIWQQNQNKMDTSRKSQKAYRKEKSVQNARKNAGSKVQKDFNARDKADK